MCERESVKVKVWMCESAKVCKWKCANESVRVKVWTCESVKWKVWKYKMESATHRVDHWSMTSSFFPFCTLEPCLMFIVSVHLVTWNVSCLEICSCSNPTWGPSNSTRTSLRNSPSLWDFYDYTVPNYFVFWIYICWRQIQMTLEGQSTETNCLVQMCNQR